MGLNNDDIKIKVIVGSSGKEDDKFEYVCYYSLLPKTTRGMYLGFRK